MSKVKIIFFDIDGTLIDMTKKAISDKTVETLIRLKENGVKICIATGRAPGSVPKFEGVDFDAFLTFNGSYCYNSSDTILSTPIPKVDVEKMIENATKINRPVSIASKDRVVANGTDKDLSDYFGFAKQEVPVSDDFDEVLKDEIYQMMMGGRNDEYVCPSSMSRAACSRRRLRINSPAETPAISFSLRWSCVRLMPTSSVSFSISVLLSRKFL